MRQEYRAQVIDAITAKLQALGDSSLIERIAKKMEQLVADEAPAIKRNSTPDILARHIATCMVEHAPVTDVVPALINLMHDLSLERANQLADIIDEVLPLNYAPDVLQRLHTQITKERFGFVEATVTIPTLAEIIMAGYDQVSPWFDVMLDRNGRLRGPVALDYLQGPEGGPGGANGETAHLLAVSDFLWDLLALLHIAPERASHPQDDAALQAALQTEIANYATNLQGALEGHKASHKERTVYCVLKLPEASPERDFRKRVLRTISEKLIPEKEGKVALVFVELMVHRADARQAKVAHFISYIHHNIRARYVRTQNKS